MYINGKQINFTLKHSFEKEKNYKIIIITNNNLPKSLKNMFSHGKYIKKIEFINCDTSNVINMNGMFESCNSLTFVDVSKFNTSNVIDMGCMFAKC